MHQTGDDIELRLNAEPSLADTPVERQIPRQKRTTMIHTREREEA